MFSRGTILKHPSASEVMQLLTIVDGLQDEAARVEHVYVNDEGWVVIEQ